MKKFDLNIFKDKCKTFYNSIKDKFIIYKDKVDLDKVKSTLIKFKGTVYDISIKVKDKTIVIYNTLKDKLIIVKNKIVDKYIKLKNKIKEYEIGNKINNLYLKIKDKSKDILSKLNINIKEIYFKIKNKILNIDTSKFKNRIINIKNNAKNNYFKLKDKILLYINKQKKKKEDIKEKNNIHDKISNVKVNKNTLKSKIIKINKRIKHNISKIINYIRINLLPVFGILIIAFSIYLRKCINVASFEQCLYAFMKIEGTSSSPLISGFLYTSFYFIIGLILLMPLLIIIKKYNSKNIIKIKDKEIKLHKISNNFIGVSFIIIAFISMSLHVGLFPFIKNTLFSRTELFDEYYTSTEDVKITFPDKKKNLIYIFVESGEMSNASIDDGGLFKESLIPNMERIAFQNTNFSNTEKLGGALPSFGTGWTVAGMIANTSGVPLKIMPSDFKDSSTRFLNIRTLGDILNDNGYSNYLLLGSDASFGGRRAYFNSHQYLVDDYLSATSDGRLPSDYYKWWGYEDSKLFDFAKEELTKISKSNKPFNYTILTSNTHFTDGYTEESCQSKFKDKYANSFYCFDTLLNEFIEWIKKEDFYKDTVIIIVGDHHTMQNSFYPDNNKTDRTIYNAIINSDRVATRNKNRIFTSLDMFPTTIAAIGGEIYGNRLGLGTNLYSDLKTVPELMEIDNFNKELMKYSHRYYKDVRKEKTLY